MERDRCGGVSDKGEAFMEIGELVAIDTGPFIYYIEENRRFLSACEALFTPVQEGKMEIVTSIITLLEVLVQPLRRGRRDLALMYRNLLLNSEGVTTVNLSPLIAEEAARLRAQYGILTPDAIQLATAIISGSNAFVTSDKKLKRIKNIPVIHIEEFIA